MDKTYLSLKFFSYKIKLILSYYLNKKAFIKKMLFVIFCLC